MIRMDNGVHFIAKIFQEALRKLGVKPRFCLVGNPMSNGSVESEHRNLSPLLENNLETLPNWTLMKNLSISKPRGKSPYELVFGPQRRQNQLNHIAGFGGEGRSTELEEETKQKNLDYKKKMYKDKKPFPSIKVDDEVIFEGRRYSVEKENNTSVIIQPLNSNLPPKKVPKRQLIFVR